MPPAPDDGLTGADAGDAADGVAETPAGADGRVGAEIVGVGGRMSEPYVGSGPAGAAEAAGAAPAGPAKYVAPESVTEVCVLLMGAAGSAGGASTTGACAVAGTVVPAFEIAGSVGTCGWTGPVTGGVKLFGTADVGAPESKPCMSALGGALVDIAGGANALAGAPDVNALVGRGELAIGVLFKLAGEGGSPVGADAGPTEGLP